MLFVDDDTTLRLATRMPLERLGYSVLLAADGQEALDVYRAHADAIDLIVLDVLLPKMMGPEVYATLRREGWAVKVLFTSGSAAPEELRERLSTMLQARFLPKPWTYRLLAKRIREVLDE